MSESDCRASSSKAVLKGCAGISNRCVEVWAATGIAATAAMITPALQAHFRRTIVPSIRLRVGRSADPLTPLTRQL